MAVSKGYKVRPSTERELRDVFKIFLSPANLLLLGMKPGDLCDVKTSEDYVAPAIAWNAKEKIKDDIVQTSSALQKLYSFKLDERISVISSHDSCEKATNITFCELQNDSVNHSLPILNILTEADRHFWARVLQCSLDRDGQSSGLTITPGLVFENVEVQGRKKSFQVLNVNSSDRRMLYYAQSTCEVYITTQATREDEDRVLFVSGDGLGGLRSQLKQINDTLRSYCEPFQSHSHPREFLACKGFILLYGAPRTGKSLVLRKISEASWQGVFRIERSMLYESSSEKDSAVTRIFSSALNAQPSLIIIDDLDSPDAKGIVHDFGRPLNVELLGEQMDRLGVHRTLVVGAATRLSDVDPRLRQDERFAQEIEIPVPDSVSRGEILKVLADLPKEASHPLLDSIAGRTHGFVAGDLKRLLNQAIRLYQVRKGMLSPEAELKDTAKNGPGFIHADMELDFKNALSNVHPSAMHNIFVEPPNVRWTDIGGQHKVKKILEKAVVWPLTVGKFCSAVNYFADLS